jgi:NADH:ubiquinone oxidoreductase subunit 2 (subunit N)
MLQSIHSKRDRSFLILTHNSEEGVPPLAVFVPKLLCWYIAAKRQISILSTELQIDSDLAIISFQDQVTSAL